jgi:hypothetical protein
MKTPTKTQNENWFDALRGKYVNLCVFDADGDRNFEGVLLGLMTVGSQVSYVLETDRGLSVLKCSAVTLVTLLDHEQG